MIFFAVASPTPFNDISSSADALLTSIKAFFSEAFLVSPVAAVFSLVAPWIDKGEDVTRALA